MRRTVAQPSGHLLGLLKMGVAPSRANDTPTFTPFRRPTEGADTYGQLPSYFARKGVASRKKVAASVAIFLDDLGSCSQEFRCVVCTWDAHTFERQVS